MPIVSMEDIKTLFEVNKGKRVDILLSSGMSISGEVDSVQENHVAIKSGGSLFCVFYRQIIYVRLV